MRNELLCEAMFLKLTHAKVMIGAWATSYNTERPLSALHDESPADYARTVTTEIARPIKRDDISARRGIT